MNPLGRRGGERWLNVKRGDQPARSLVDQENEDQVPKHAHSAAKRR